MSKHPFQQVYLDISVVLGFKPSMLIIVNLIRLQCLITVSHRSSCHTEYCQTEEGRTSLLKA